MQVRLLPGAPRIYMIIISASVLITKDDTVLFVHETKVDKYGLPGGKLEAGESLRDCAIRECQEEVGVTPVIDRLVLVSQKPDSREGNNVVRFIYEAHLDKEATPSEDGEFVYEYLTKERITELAAEDRIRGKDVIEVVDRFYQGSLAAIAEPEIFT